jgi:hypothetical protein
MTGAGQQAAEHALTQWAQREREQGETRDGLVLGAIAAGVSKHRIHVLTGIARTTIDKIMATQEHVTQSEGIRE